MSDVAHYLGMDQAEIRRKNFIPADAFPYTNAANIVYDSGDYERALDQALAHLDIARMPGGNRGASRAGRDRRHRHRQLRRGLRRRRRGWLGHAASRRPRDGDHGYIAARAGSGDEFRADHRRHPRRADGGDRRHARRYRHRARAAAARWGAAACNLAGTRSSKRPSEVRERLVAGRGAPLEVEPTDLMIPRGDDRPGGRAGRALPLGEVIAAAREMAVADGEDLATGTVSA